MYEFMLHVSLALTVDISVVLIVYRVYPSRLGRTLSMENLDQKDRKEMLGKQARMLKHRQYLDRLSRVIRATWDRRGNKDQQEKMG